MEFKGTKGNWRIDEETFNNDYKDNSNVVSIREETKGGYYIAEVYKNVGFDTIEDLVKCDLTLTKSAIKKIGL